MAVSGQRRRPVVALYERIADAVHDGTYPPGSTLPSEPKLATELGVSFYPPCARHCCCSRRTAC